MFAGEGPGERTNERFHLPGRRASRPRGCRRPSTRSRSTARTRTGSPDIYGKIGESGVSIFTVEEAEQLYAGFDLCDPQDLGLA